jgi:hypothetical protein
MSTETWIDKLRAGHLKEALDQLRQEPTNPSNFYSLGAAYMWAREYRLALAHFQNQIEAALPSNPPGDLSFGMAGAAAWCLGDSKQAVKYWRHGTKAGYAVGGSNTRTSLLLYAAAVLDAEAFSLRAAHELLVQKASHWRVRNWAGPVAEFITGRATEQAVREKAVFEKTKTQPVRKNAESWQLDFYTLLKAAASGDIDSDLLKQELRSLVNVKGSEYLNGSNFFYFLRLEEFYVVRQWSSGRV